MSQIAVFYLIKTNLRQELSDGNCSGNVYMAIWDWCESELDIDIRRNASQFEETADCALIDEKMAGELLVALKEHNLLELAVEIASEWDIPDTAVERGIRTLLSHLKKVQHGTLLLYEMI